MSVVGGQVSGFRCQWSVVSGRCQADLIHCLIPDKCNKLRGCRTSFISVRQPFLEIHGDIVWVGRADRQSLAGFGPFK